MHVRVASPDDPAGVARVHERAWCVGYAHVFDAEKLAARRVDVDRWRSMLEESPDGRATFGARRLHEHLEMLVPEVRYRKAL